MQEHSINLTALPGHLTADEITFVCVGTDRSTGDSLGPLVGTMLQQMGYTNVIGTMDEPCHAVNLVERLKEVPDGRTVIGIDACLGKLTSVGNTTAKKGPLHPGAGVGKNHLPPVGDYRIEAVVNVGGFMEYFVLQNTRLSLVMKMAGQIANSLAATYPIHAAEAAAGGSWSTWFT